MTGSSALSPRPGSSRGQPLLVLAFAATFLSRAAAGSVVEGLRAELWLTDQALGTLVSAFAGVYAVTLPAGAFLATKRRWTASVALGLAVCGLATIASAVAIGFWTLVPARMAAGAGAGLADGLVVSLLRGAGGRALARPPRRLLMGAAAGLAVGYALGGLCGSFLGWRAAYVSTGIGLLGASFAFARAKAPALPAVEPWASLHTVGALRALGRLARRADRALPALAAVLGGAALGALAFWLPAFLERTRGVPRAVAGVQLAAAVLASGFAGAALGRAVLRRPRAGPSTCRWMAAGGAGVAAAGVASALAFSSPMVVLPGIMATMLGAFLGTRGAVSALGGDPDPALVGLALVLVHALGELGGAFALGAMADRVSFGKALYLLPFILLATAVVWAAAARQCGRTRGAQKQAA